MKETILHLIFLIKEISTKCKLNYFVFIFTSIDSCFPKSKYFFIIKAKLKFINWFNELSAALTIPV